MQGEGGGSRIGRGLRRREGLRVEKGGQKEGFQETMGAQGGERGLLRGRGMRRRRLLWNGKRGRDLEAGEGSEGIMELVLGEWMGLSELARSSGERDLGTRMKLEDRLGLRRLSLALALPT